LDYVIKNELAAETTLKALENQNQNQNQSDERLQVSRSLGMGLDQKAIDAVKLWKFEPGMKDGQAVAVQVNIEVNFRLY
jgi:TonB family protein